MFFYFELVQIIEDYYAYLKKVYAQDSQKKQYQKKCTIYHRKCTFFFKLNNIGSKNPNEYARQPYLSGPKRISLAALCLNFKQKIKFNRMKSHPLIKN